MCCCGRCGLLLLVGVAWSIFLLRVRSFSHLFVCVCVCFVGVVRRCVLLVVRVSFELLFALCFGSSLWCVRVVVACRRCRLLL